MLTLLPSWSVGSVLFLLSWAVLMGPWSYAKHLVSGSRLPFTAAYFGSITMTLYFAIGVRKSFPCRTCSSSPYPYPYPPPFVPLHISRRVARRLREKGESCISYSILQYDVNPSSRLTNPKFPKRWRHCYLDITLYSSALCNRARANPCKTYTFNVDFVFAFAFARV